MMLNCGEIEFGIWDVVNNPVTILRVIGTIPGTLKVSGICFISDTKQIVYLPLLN